MKHCPCGQTISCNKMHCLACFEKREFIYLLMLKATRPMPEAHGRRLEELRHKFATPDTREQIISFAYGNIKLHKPEVTREMVEQEFDQLRAAA